MARTNTRFVEAHNKMLTICDKMKIGEILPSENTLSSRLGVSRTVVRKVLAELETQSMIALNGREKTVSRRSTSADRSEAPPVLLGIDELEGRFLNWVLRMDVPSGTTLNVAQLAKDFSTATHTLQEFFSSLSRFGIVARRPKGGWVLHGFTKEYALELSDFRTMLELHSVRQLVTLPETHDIWGRLDALERDHRDLLDRIDADFHDFSPLDEAFHAAINNVVQNRFANEFQKIISLVFHYHYQWNKSDERTRNENAINEHLQYIDALRSRDLERALEAANRHLRSSKQTLLTSLKINTETA